LPADVGDADVLAECVINVSQGRDHTVIDGLTTAGGGAVLDVHTDAEHNRSVYTIAGPLPVVEDASRRLVAAAIASIDITTHAGVHPRFGVADVVPFVALDRADLVHMVRARDRFAVWAGETLGLPCFTYGPERSLPEVRREAFRSLPPQTGPPTPHPSAGASAVGARPPLVAYNIWIAQGDAEADDISAVARTIAASLRSPDIRSLGLPVTIGAQVSCNLIAPESTTVYQVYDAVSSMAGSVGAHVVRAELVGLIQRTALERVPKGRWAELDLSEERTIEGRLGT
jgi:glutamate formiminotransferase